MEDYPAELLDQAGLLFSDKNMFSFENAYEDFLTKGQFFLFKHKENLEMKISIADEYEALK